VKVVLSGDGGDEMFGGYARYGHDLREAEIRDRIPGLVRSLVLKPLAAIWPKADWLPRPLRLKTLMENLSCDPAEAYANTVSTCRHAMRRQLLRRDFAASLNDYHPEHSIIGAFRQGHRDPLSGMLSADTNILLPDDFLTKVDRASMGFGLEVRTPLIDWKLMELAASMPSEFKIRSGSKKWILKQLFESRLPKDLVHRPKQGFELPVDQWLRGPLSEQVRTHVLNHGGAIAQFVDVSKARRLFESHCRGVGRHGQLIWSLLVFARWLDAWGKPEGMISRKTDRHTRPVSV
jgi:asparagine synthase (glutamine-hydrolysing)